MAAIRSTLAVYASPADSGMGKSTAPSTSHDGAVRLWEAKWSVTILVFSRMVCESWASRALGVMVGAEDKEVGMV